MTSHEQETLLRRKQQEMDFVSSYKEKLLKFRIKELKDVITRLGLSKQGKKQDLLDRIVASLSIEASDLQDLAKKKIMPIEEVAGIIEDAYRKLQSVEATSSSMNKESYSEIDNIKPKEEVVDHLYLEKKIRCLCGSSLPTEPLIQCADKHCGVLQHKSCVIIPEELSDGTPAVPPEHYCEICRIKRADPFRVTVTHVLSPVKLMISSIPHDGSNPVQNVEKQFQLTTEDIDLLQNNDYNIQAWSILLNDKVQFRMQWPLYADLKLNGVPVRTVNRPGSQLLGANGRDDGPMIAFYMVKGLNQISLSGWDARSFCIGVRIVMEHSVQQILEIILEERNVEPLKDSLARVQRCIGGGIPMATEDSDSDLEVISDCVTFNLRCPMSGLRIKTAGRFRACAHMGCFDLETFVQLNQRSRKWQCPICLKNYSLEDVTVDPYFSCITKMVQDCEEDVTEIDVKFDGSWRVKNGHGFKDLYLWHLPDGSLCNLKTATVSNSAALRQSKEEGIFQDIYDGEVTRVGDIQTISRQGEHYENYSEDVITMSGSSCESLGDGDHSVNKNGMVNLDISARYGHMTNATFSNLDATAKPLIEKTSVPLSNFDIIVLSDSDEETASFMSPASLSQSHTISDSGHFVPSGRISNADIESVAPATGSSSSVGILYCNDNSLLTSHQTKARADSELQFPTSEGLDALIDPACTPLTSSPLVHGNLLTLNCSKDHDAQVVNSSVCHSDTQRNGSLVSSQAWDIITSQTSSRSQSSALSMQSEMHQISQKSNSNLAENFPPSGFVGSIGVGINKPHSNTSPSGESKEALLHPDTNKKVRPDLSAKRNRSSGPFVFPRRARSARR